MRTVTVQLPDDLAQMLDQIAGAEGRSKSSLVRIALEDYIACRQGPDQLTMAGLGAARLGDLVAHEELLPEFDEWGRGG